MKKKTLLIAGLSLLAAGLTAVAITGCSSYKFEEYSYNYGGTAEEHWRDLTYPDSNITVDGIVNTSEYGEQHLSFSDVNGVNMKVYAHMGEKGVFFGFVSNDRYVNYNPRNTVFNNTSVEIQVAPNGTETLNSNVVQLRLGANGTPDQWVGFPSEDGYSYSNKYIPSMGVVHINGELNKSADGYSVELYLPYTSIGYGEEETPDSVVCAPSFNTMPDPQSSTRATWTLMLGCQLDAPATWYVVDGAGITARTAGFEKSGTTVTQSKGGNQFYYFDTAPSESYYLKTSLTVSTTISGTFLNNDNFPKFGLVNKSENALQAFYIDAANRNGTNFGTVRAIQSTKDQTNWQWDDNASTSIAGHWGNDYIGGTSALNAYQNKKLETIYYGGDLYFVLDDVLVKTVKNFAPTTDGAVPGFMCFNTKATFAKNEYETDPAKVKAEAEKYMAKELKIDGDLADWTNADVNKHSKTVEDATNGNSMTVRAFKGSDGLYIAYNVHHNVNLAPTKWDNGWTSNTNVELYINGTSEKHHYGLTTFGNGGYMDGVMFTTREADRTYSTVAEIFIPFASLEKDGYDKNDTLEVGFAFKSSDGTPASYMNGNEWWAIEGTPTAVQFVVGEKGIGVEYTLTYTAGEEEGVTGTAPAPVKAFGGESVQLAENPFTRTGYKFAGWTDGVNGYAAGDTIVMPEGGLTLYPRWISNSASTQKHSVTYQKAGTEEGTLPTDSNTYAEGELVTLKEANLTLANHRFVGWNDGIKTYSAGSKIFMGSEDITLTAVWKEIFTVSYAAGATDFVGELPEPEEYVSGDVVVLKNATISREGYVFVGWKSSVGGDDKIYAPGDVFTMLDEQVTFTAQWEIKITLDGKLNDWNALKTKTIGSQSITDRRRATWYGMLRDDGLYLAVDLYHNNLGQGKGDWWRNLNVELHLGKANTQHYVYIKTINTGLAGLGASWTIGTSSSSILAAYNYASGIAGGTTHHSTFEIFLPTSMIAGSMEMDGSVRVGVAVKTDDENEKITGGSFNYASGDAWYMPYGVVADNYNYFAYVTQNGMYLKNEYAHKDDPSWTIGKNSAVVDDGSIVLDANLSDWDDANTIAIKGSGQYTGKGATFYGKLTQSYLYLAVDAYHSVYTKGQNDWWNNTNFELRIGEAFGGEGHQLPKQFWVYATADYGTDAFSGNESYMEIKSQTTLSSGMYHTVIEMRIPVSELVKNDYMIQNGMIHVGVAWKTNGDTCNDLGVDGGTGAWWVPKDMHVNGNPACVDGTGMYLPKNYNK